MKEHMARHLVLWCLSSRLHLAQYQWNQEYRGSQHPERFKVKDHRSSGSSAEDKGDPDFTEKAYLGVENSYRRGMTSEAYFSVSVEIRLVIIPVRYVV